jgi:hypothetical protein
VVFTVPHELESLWHRNPVRMNDVLCRSVRATLLELLRDGRYLGAVPGILAALHTWGRTLSFHPHVHCLVTGGGWDGEQWRPVRNGYLLPVRVLRALFRGKFLAEVRSLLEHEKLRQPADRSATQTANLLRQLGQRRWNVFVSERYAHAEGVAIYLARYVRGGPIGEQRLLALGPDGVRLAYREATGGCVRSLQLPMAVFLQRFGWHVPHPGRHAVRYWGLYARSCAQVRLLARAQLPPQRDAPSRLRSQTPRAWSAAERDRCPLCGQHLVFFAVERPASRDPPSAPVQVSPRSPSGA